MQIQQGQVLRIRIGNTEQECTVRNTYEYKTDRETGILAGIDIPGYANNVEYYFLTNKDSSGILNNSGMPLEYMSKRAKDFKFDLYHENMDFQKKIVNAMVKRFNEFRMQGRGLYIYSKCSGSGKTLLACVIANEIIKEYQISCKFVTVTDYRDLCKRKEPGLERIMDADLLIIDDIGAQDEKQGWINEILHSLIDRRSKGMRSTIFTSNRDFRRSAISANERLGSIICDISVPVKLPEESIRDHQADKFRENFISGLLQE